VRQFIQWSALEIGITIRFEGKGLNEVGIVESIKSDNAPALKVGDIILRIDKRYFRPAEVETLLGSSKKAKDELGWVPEITVQEMCTEMVREDLKKAKRNALLKEHGYKIHISKE
jgi:GDPmannose 4,6-dehydratase